MHSTGHDVKDYGDIEMVENSENPLGPNGEKNFYDVMEYNQRLANAVSSVVSENRICVTLGGDHSIAIGTIQGHAAAKSDKQVLYITFQYK